MVQYHTYEQYHNISSTAFFADSCTQQNFIGTAASATDKADIS